MTKAMIATHFVEIYDPADPINARTYHATPAAKVAAPVSGRTASGYGSRIPTTWKVFFRGKWRRVYCKIYSNAGTCYVRVHGQMWYLLDGTLDSVKEPG